MKSIKRIKSVKHVCVLLSLCAFLIFSCKMPVWASYDTQTVKFYGTYHQTTARSMLSGINQLRTGSEAWYYDRSGQKEYRYGLSTLLYDAGLEEIAKQRAAEISVVYQHERPNGSSCFSLYDTNSYKGENIAYGYELSDAGSVLEMFKETNCSYEGQGHRRNMLNSNFSYVGLACFEVDGYYFWVQEFCSVSESAGTGLSAADDRYQAVTVEVNRSYIAGTTLVCEEEKFNLKAGETCSPIYAALTMQFYNANHSQNGFKRKLADQNLTFSVEDTKIAYVDGTLICGRAAGNTYLVITDKSSYHAAALRIPVSVSAPLKAGSRFQDKAGNTYKILSLKSKTVAFVGNTDINADSVDVPNKVSCEGTKYTVTEIGKKAFSKNKYVQDITIGKNVRKIGAYAFKGCKKLQNVWVNTKKLKSSGLNKAAFSGMKKGINLIVPKKYAGTYGRIFRKKGLPKSCRIWSF